MEDTVRNSAGNIITIGRAVTEFAKTATTKAAELAPYETLSYKCLPIVGVALGTWIDIEIGEETPIEAFTSQTLAALASLGVIEGGSLAVAELGLALGITIAGLPEIIIVSVLSIAAGYVVDEFVDTIFDAHKKVNDIKETLNLASTIPSPIVLDLNGDGVTTTALTSGTYFDHAGDGFAEQTAWVSPEDGLLVRDLNHNGTIDTGAELFGNNTVLANGQKAANGFLALADLDTNKDGKIDVSDTAFSELQVWKDANGDGITSTGELHSLTELGIVSISTAYTASSTVDANGNSHSQTGTYTTTDGQTRAATDVWFKTASLYSFATEILEVPEDILNLPEISGYGHVRSLQQAMA